MKKILFIIILTILLISTKSFSQGLTRSLFDSTGWSVRGGSSQHYALPFYTLLSNPGGLINKNTYMVDSLLNALIVYTDTKQLVIRNDTLIISDTASGSHSFTSTATSDSVAISGFDSLDIIIVTPLATAYNVNDILFVEERTGYFKIYRNTGGTSGLKYNYLWIRKYQ